MSGCSNLRLPFNQFLLLFLPEFYYMHSTFFRTFVERLSSTFVRSPNTLLLLVGNAMFKLNLLSQGLRRLRITTQIRLFNYSFDLIRENIESRQFFLINTH